MEKETMTTGKNDKGAKNPATGPHKSQAVKPNRREPKLTATEAAEDLGCNPLGYQALDLLGVLLEYGAFNSAEAFPVEGLVERFGLCPEHLAELAREIFCGRFAVLPSLGRDLSVDGLYLETNPEAVRAIAIDRMETGIGSTKKIIEQFSKRVKARRVEARESNRQGEALAMA
jgi:hypothetical protein